jgi:predicted phage tail protein
MFAVVQNGEVRQIIQPDVGFTIGEKQYSARFIRNATEAERKAVGVYEIIYGEQKDQRFYWVTGPTYRVNEVNQTVEATFTATAKALEDRPEVKEDGSPLYVQTYNPATQQMEDTTEQVVTKGLKSNWIAQTKAAANSALAQTDWMVIRKAERNVDIPADVAAARAKILSDCAAKEAAITACTTVEQLMAAV